MAWLRRSRFRNRVQKSDSINTNIPLTKPKLAKDVSGRSSSAKGSIDLGKNGLSQSLPGWKPRGKSARIDTGRDDPKKAGRRFFSFLKKKDQPSKPFVHKIPSPLSSPLSDDGTIEGTVDTSDITAYSSSSCASTPSSSDGNLHMIPMSNGHNSMFFNMSADEDDGSDAELCFRTAKKIKTEGTATSPMFFGSVVAPRQSSELSQLTTASLAASARRNSASSEYSSLTTKDNDGSRSGSRYSDSSRNGSSGDSVSSCNSDKSATLTALFSLRGELSAIPDNSYHSTVTEDCSTYMHGNSKHGSDSVTNNLDRIRENMEMSLYLRTVPVEEKEDVFRKAVPLQQPVSPAQPPVAFKSFHKPRSFLPTVQPETLPFLSTQASPPPRTVTPPPTQSQDRTPSPTLAQEPKNSANQIHLIPLILERDLSLEEPVSVVSVSQLSMDLSMDLESVIPSTQLMPEEDSPLRQSLEDVLTDLRDVDEANQHSRPETCSSSGCNTSTGSEDMGAAIRSGMLNGSLFDSDPDSSASANSSSKGSTANSVPYRNLDEDVVMEEKSHASEGSYHFCNLPLELQNDHVSMQGGDSNSDSEVATASSDEDITHLEELYSDIFGEEEDDPLLRPVSSSEGESDLSSGTLSMLGLFKDDKSCQSSVVSFDSSEFLEDEQFDDYSSLHSRSKASCSISMHDITTIHEENEDDIAEEDEEDLHDVLMGGTDMEYPPPMPLNGELHMRRNDLVTPGSSGTFSSVTDDSYMGCMSFDSLSLASERGNSPRGFYRKFAGNGIAIDMSNHQDFVNLERPSLQQPFNDESSQFTFESSRISVGDSACSYDSFSSESVKYMVDILKEEAERRRNKIKERIAKIRESTDRVSHVSKYVAHRLGKGDEEDSTLS